MIQAFPEEEGRKQEATGSPHPLGQAGLQVGSVQLADTNPGGQECKVKDPGSLSPHPTAFLF